MHLPALQTSAGHLCLLELDKVAQLAGFMGLSLSEPSNLGLVRQVLGQKFEHLSTSVSGLVLEPEYGLPLLVEEQKRGLVLALDFSNSDEVDPLQLPQLIQNWGVVAIKNNYAAAKITLYYHPNEEKALQKKQLIAELFDHCRHEGIDLVLKLMLYTKADEEFSIPAFQEMQLQAVSEFRTSCNALALQYPQDSLACATLTTELDVPWMVVGDGQNYDTFKEVVRDAMEGGAAGFMAGEPFWQEIKNLRREDVSPDVTAIEQFIKTTARDRAIELVRIVEEF